MESLPLGQPALGQYEESLFTTPSPSPDVEEVTDKRLVVKVFDKDRNYIKTWADWTDPPSYRWPINDGPQAMTINLPRDWNHLGEPGEDGSDGDMMLDNIVQLWVVDKETPLSGSLFYDARLMEYEPGIREGQVSVTLVPMTSVLSGRYIDDEEAIQFDGQDPTDVVFALVGGFYCAGFNWNMSNPLVGLEIVTQLVGKGYVKDILNLCQRFAGGDWYWRAELNDIHPIPWMITFNKSHSILEPVTTRVDHRLVIGKHIADVVHYRRSGVNRYTRVIVIGADVEDLDGNVIDKIKAIAISPTDNPLTDPRDFVYANTQITDPYTAKQVAQTFLNFYNMYSVESNPIRVIDSNFDPEKGYDIESLKPGDTVQVVDPRAEPFYHLVGDHIVGDGHIIGGSWNAQVLLPYTISEVNYNWTYADITLQRRPNRLVEEMVNLSTRLLIEETA